MEKIKYELSEPDFENINSKLIVKSEVNNNINENIDYIYTPFKFNNLKLKNHFVFMNLSDELFYNYERIPNEDFNKFYNNILKSNVGLIITGGMFYIEDLNLKNKQGLIDINSKQTIDSHKNLVSEVHSYGCKFFFQIKPIFGREDNVHKFLNLLNFSVINCKSTNNANFPCLKLPDNKCNEIVNAFLKLAKFSNMVGYDGIVINGDLSNILGEFASKEFNRRTFGYFSEYQDLSIKIVKNINAQYSEMNIIYTITIDSFFKKIFKEELRNIKTLNKISCKCEFEQVCEFLINLVKNGVDGFIFKFGAYENSFLNTFNSFESEYLFFDYYKAISEYFKEINLKNKFNENVVLILSDNIYNFDKSSIYLKNEVFNLIDVTKNLYSDNKFLKKLKNKIQFNPCIKCSYCNKLSNDGKLGCLVNPNLFGEEMRIINLKTPKRVAIVGSGLSGIICANNLAIRGYFVDLYEKASIVNKNGRLEEIFRFDECLISFNNSLESELYLNVKTGKINLFLNTEFEFNKAQNEYYSIILATGHKEKTLNINGSVLKNVKSIYEILNNANSFENVDKISILVKSELSLKLALFLLLNNKKITLIIPDISKLFNLSDDKYSYYFYQLKNLKANVYINSRVNKIEDDFIEVSINSKFPKYEFYSLAMNLKSKIKYKTEKKIINIDSDLFIYESDLVENNKLYYDLVVNGYDGELYMIGDALKISDLADTIKSAYYVSKNL